MQILEYRFPLSLFQQSYRSHSEFLTAITRGLGERRIDRWWRVLKRRENYGIVSYYIGKEQVGIHGFTGHRQVYSDIYEAGGFIIADFYPDKMVERSEANLIKRVRLSRCLKGGKWLPMNPPQVVFVQSGKVQRERVEAARIYDFLVSDRKEGDFIDIKPRHVSNHGEISFGCDGKYILMCRYGKFKRQLLDGQIRVAGDEKRAYFWQKDAASRTTDAAIFPEGHVVAKKTAGYWEIVWGSWSPLKRKARKAAETYTRYLLTTVGSAAFEELWPVFLFTERGNPRKRFGKVILGHRLFMPSMNFASDKSVFSVTRELSSRIKLVEFWDMREDFVRGVSPKAARFVAIGVPGNGGWQIIWSKIDSIADFQQMVAQNVCSPRFIFSWLKDPYLQSHYPQIVKQLCVNPFFDLL